MNETASGLVLRTRPLTETSLIVHWLTPTAGRLATVAKGARRPKSPFFGKLDLFYEADFSFARSRRSELHTLREVRLLNPHAGLRQDLGHLRQASYATALVEQTTETDTPLPQVYELMQGFLNWLPQHPAQPRGVYAFELKLLHELGLSPDLDQTNLEAGTRQTIQTLTFGSWQEIAGLKATAAQAREIRNFLHGFLIYHLGRMPRHRAAALTGEEATSPGSAAGRP